jgi:hypothetical protein
LVATAAVAASCFVATAAQAIEVLPSSDVWIRQSSPATIFEDDGIWISGAHDGGQLRVGVVQFNISSVGVPITSAWLELHGRGSGSATLSPATWVNSTVQPGSVGSLTYADYEFFIQPSEASFEALGGGDFSQAAVPQNTYGLTDSATTADRAALNAIRTGDGIITMIFKAATGGREFSGDDVYSGHLPFKLVINEQLPVAGDLDGDFDVDPTDYGLLKGNWRMTVPVGTGGDFTGDGTVSLQDFVIFRGHYETFNGLGSAAALSAVPEPASIALAIVAVPALWWLKRRRVRG